MEVDSLSSSHPVSTPAESPVQIRDMLDKDDDFPGKNLEAKKVDSLSSSHPVSTPVESCIYLRDMLDKHLPRYLRTLRSISANSLQDWVDECQFLGTLHYVGQKTYQEEISSAGMNGHRKDTAPLQSKGHIDEVDVDQPNPSKGSRVKLGDIPRINHQLSKMTTSDLKPLHILIFDTPGKRTSMKRDMRQFNGFAFEVDSEPYIRRREKMLRFQMTKLKVICKVLRLKASEKPKMVDRILSFLNCPSIHGPVPRMREPEEMTHRPIMKGPTRGPPKKRQLLSKSQKKEELSSAGMNGHRKDTAPLQSKGHIDEVDVDQPNSSEAIGEVHEGKRKKKTVERLHFYKGHIYIHNRQPVDVGNGRGVQLGDIPEINKQFSKMNASDLTPLHRVLFNRPGKRTSMKRDLRLFNGFAFKVGSEPYIRKQNNMLRFTMIKLRVICNVLGQKASSQKPYMVDRILSFLNRPSIKNLSFKSKEKPKKKADKNAPPDKNTPPYKSSFFKKPVNTGFFLRYSDPEWLQRYQSDLNGSHKSVREDSSVAVREDNSDDDVPLIKFKEKRLSNEQLKETIQKVLKEANLEEITMKQICQKVYDTYPDLDLTHRKGYIKETVKMMGRALLESDPVNTQESDPVNMQESDLLDPQESDPLDPQESDPLDPQESDPLDTQESDPLDTQESDPLDTQESDPDYTQESDPDYTQESDPLDPQESDPLDPQESDPLDTQESEPLDTQESDPLDMQESDPVDMQGFVPVNTQESAWRTRVQNTQKSDPVIMDTGIWIDCDT